MTISTNISDPSRFDQTPDFRHIITLAREANISLEVCGRCTNSFADPHGRRVHIPPPDGSDEAYAVALHELGHLLDPQGVQLSQDQMMGVKLGLTHDPEDTLAVYSEELAAWDWARRHAQRWTPEMEYRAQEGLSSYRAGLDFGEAA